VDGAWTPRRRLGDALRTMYTSIIKPVFEKEKKEIYLEQQNYKVQQVSTIVILRLQPIISMRKVNLDKEVLEMYIRVC